MRTRTSPALRALLHAPAERDGNRDQMPHALAVPLTTSHGRVAPAAASVAAMGDTTIIKVESDRSPRGAMGQVHLASGVSLSMRMWQERPASDPDPEVAREYETVGYVISGRAELHSEGQVVVLAAGDSWVVPRGAVHTYTILEPFTAVEATHPPAQVHGRDEPAAG